MISILALPMLAKAQGRSAGGAYRSRRSTKERTYCLYRGYNPAASFRRVQAKFSFGMSANDANGALARLLLVTIRQWQMLFCGAADNAKRMAPHHGSRSIRRGFAPMHVPISVLCKTSCSIRQRIAAGGRRNRCTALHSPARATRLPARRAALPHSLCLCPRLKGLRLRRLPRIDPGRRSTAGQSRQTSRLEPRS